MMTRVASMRTPRRFWGSRTCWSANRKRSRVDNVKASPNLALMAPWELAAWVAFIGYGIATIFGKNLEHS